MLSHILHSDINLIWQLFAKLLAATNRVTEQLSWLTAESFYMSCLGLAKTVLLMHRIWPYIWWIPCQRYRICTVYIWFWPTLVLFNKLDEGEASLLMICFKPGLSLSRAKAGNWLLCWVLYFAVTVICYDMDLINLVINWQHVSILRLSHINV